MTDPNFKLTEQEQEAEAKDQALLNTVRAFNDVHAAPAFPLPPSAILASELTYWSSAGNVSKVKLALQQDPDVNHADEEGYTALHAAAENGHVEIVRLLLACGAKQTTCVGELTPADLAQDYPEVLQLLAKKFE